MKHQNRRLLVIGIALLSLLLLALGLAFFRFRLPPPENRPLSIRMPEHRPLRIAQLADLHFGDGESPYHNTKEERTKAFLSYVVKSQKPDLLVCSGDQLMSTGVQGVLDLIELMDSFKTPWTFVWGNHDAESNALGYSKREVSATLAQSASPYLLYTDGYVEEGRENRYGNFTITVTDSTGQTPIGALVLIDSGAYLYDEARYQSITLGQVAWYEAQIDALQAQSPTGAPLPTLCFAHMPLPDFAEACRKANEGEGAEFVIAPSRLFGGGEAGTARSPLFDAMVEKGSTKAYFVGHYHVARHQVRMDGILLGFCPQAGFSHAEDTSPRSAYVYHISPDFTVATVDCTEPLPAP